MTTKSYIFNLPDLGEGLPDAEIREWHVKVGDTVKIDQPLVSMETAKAVVDVPSPQTGVIEKLYGSVSDIIITGHPLVAFQVSLEESIDDQGTVVGHIESSGKTVQEDFIIGSVGKVKATPAVKNLARQLGVDLTQVVPTGGHGVVTAADVQAFVAQQANNTQTHQDTQIDTRTELVRGARRAMVQSMIQAHQAVVAVSIFDDADIHAWVAGTDITIRLIQAIVEASKKEPALNAWYHHEQSARELHTHVNLGLAMDTAEGLFVPVIHAAETLSGSALRDRIETLKIAVNHRDVSPESLKSATITLSNFGKFAGRYATPIVVPPMVAILGVGQLREAVVVHEGNPAVHKILPLSLSFDHRAVTGGEATRFLSAIIASLKKSH